jgi:hypothetical protein
MDEIIKLLKTPDECIQLARLFTDLAKQATRRAIELRALTHGNMTEVERTLWEVIYAYEEVLSKKNKRRTHATRTRQMIKRYGILEAAERAVNRKIEAMGYKVLVDMGLQDLTFEAVIVRFPESFSPNIVELSRSRLEALGKIQ